MKKRVAVSFLVALLAYNFFPTLIYAQDGNLGGGEVLTITNSKAVALSPAAYSPQSGPFKGQKAKYVYLTVYGGSARYAKDGTTPTPAAGTQLVNRQSIRLTGAEITNCKIIAISEAFANGYLLYYF